MHGAGNDFIVVNGEEYDKLKTQEQKVYLCHRRLGIGSDGLIVIRPHQDYDFEMLFINPDGSSGMFCGNGSRCAVSQAYELGWIPRESSFLAVDGPHHAIFHDYDDIEVSMKDVDSIIPKLNGFFVDTGAPHYVEFVKELESIEVEQRGAEIRYHEQFQPEGCNANFVESKGDKLHIRTYERGVEKETLACGTGITAAALAYAHQHQSGNAFDFLLKARGGNVRIQAAHINEGFHQISMRGPVARVFQGKIAVPDTPFKKLNAVPVIRD
jgi:diaminopimelate epimerase